MSDNTNTAPHQRLAVFLGDWHSEGSNYGGKDQTPANPRASVTPWRSVFSARWHSGEYFIVQDEHANGPFDTLTLMGWDAGAERYFTHSFANLPFTRDYTMSVEGRTFDAGKV